VIPFPREAAPATLYRDPKRNNRPALPQHYPGQSPAMSFTQGLSYVAYPGSDSESMYNGFNAKEESWPASDKSVNSLLPSPYDGWRTPPEELVDRAGGDHRKPKSGGPGSQGFDVEDRSLGQTELSTTANTMPGQPPGIYPTAQKSLLQVTLPESRGL
jgi:hypothetical protein